MSERQMLHPIRMLAAILGISISAACADAPRAGLKSDPVARSVAVADLFQTRLQSRLSEALANGGPVAAVGVCAEAAPAIAAEVSAETGTIVRRVSLHPRNPGAATSDALMSRLESLEKEPVDAAGQPSLAHWTEGEGRDSTHNTLRAVIMRDQPCGACHGTAIADDVAAAITERYPQDRATGIVAGELRGAILISWLQHEGAASGESR